MRSFICRDRHSVTTTTVDVDRTRPLGQTNADSLRVETHAVPPTARSDGSYEHPRFIDEPAGPQRGSLAHSASHGSTWDAGRP